MSTTPTRPTMLVRLADWSYRRRWRVLVAWIVLLLGTVMAAGAGAGDYDFTFSTPGSESDKAQALLEDSFPARAGDDISVVFKALQGKTVDDPGVKAAIGDILGQFDQQPHVGEVISPFSAEGERQIAPERAIAYGTLRIDVTISDYELDDGKALVALAKRVDRPDLQVDLAGFMLQGTEQTEFSSEGLGLLVAALILVVSFGSLLAMGLPILIAVVGLGIGLSLVGLLANVLEVPDFAPQVAAMIGIGVGIDYVLFIVTRYRAALHSGLESRAAVITAITTSGRAVIFAGCTVIISLLGLFVMNLGFLRGLAVGATTVVLIVMLASVTLLPAMFGFIGDKIDRFRVPFVNRREAGDRESFAYRWSRIVQRRPWPAAIVCVVVLLALAAPARNMHFGFPDASNSTEDFTTRRAHDLLSEGFGAGFNGPLLLVATTPDGQNTAGGGRARWRCRGYRPERGICEPAGPQPRWQGRAAGGLSEVVTPVAGNPGPREATA